MTQTDADWLLFGSAALLAVAIISGAIGGFLIYRDFKKDKATSNE